MNDVKIRQEWVTEDGIAIHRKIITSPDIYFEVFDKIFKFEFHVVNFSEYNEEVFISDLVSQHKSRNKEEAQKFYLSKEDYFTLFPRHDYKKELGKLGLSHKQGLVYFYNKTFDEAGIEYPAFYQLIRRRIPEKDSVDFLFYLYKKEIKNQLHYFVYSQMILPSYWEDFISYSHNLGQQFIEFFEVSEKGFTIKKNKEKIETRSEKAKKTELFLKTQEIFNFTNGIRPKGYYGLTSIDEIQDKHLQTYLLFLLTEFKDFCIKQKICLQCPKCGILFPYLDKKNYCSQKCRKSSENRRVYIKSKS